MSDIDAYFTQSIVGAPFSAVLGARSAVPHARATGIEMALDASAERLKAFWHDEALLGASATGPFLRRIPSASRQWLERHALVIALAGLTSMAASGLWAFWIHRS